MSVIDRDERKYIFGEDIVITFFNMYNCIFADKLKMLYDLTNAQGLTAVEPSLTTTYLASNLDPTPIVEISTTALEVNQLIDVATTITMEEMPQSPLTTKMG